MADPNDDLSGMVSPSGQSIVGSLLSGEKDPSVLRGKPAPTGGMSGGLSSTDQDCATNSLIGFLTEPLCVAGKSITKGGGFLGGLLSNRVVWVVIAIIVILGLVAFIKK